MITKEIKKKKIIINNKKYKNDKYKTRILKIDKSENIKVIVFNNTK